MVHAGCSLNCLAEEPVPSVRASVLMQEQRSRPVCMMQRCHTKPRTDDMCRAAEVPDLLLCLTKTLESNCQGAFCCRHMCLDKRPCWKKKKFSVGPRMLLMSCLQSGGFSSGKVGLRVSSTCRNQCSFRSHLDNRLCNISILTNTLSPRQQVQ